MASFSKAHIETGRVKYDAGADAANEANNTFQVTFDKVFSGVPNVTCVVENSNKTARAINVNSTGFKIIISDTGFETDEIVYYVHYYAVLVN